MKEKIRNQLLKISFIAIIITLIISVGVFYKLFTQQVFTDLKSYIDVISYNVAQDDFESWYKESGLTRNNIRVTLISAEGKVLYDSEASSADMTNHKDRPEIANAIEFGEGSSIRHSETLGKSTYYYAKQQADGTIIRVSSNASNIWAVLLSAAPVIIGFAAILLAVCFVWSKYITKRLVEPIEAIAPNINNMSIEPAYKELVPFVNALKEQHADILRSATIRQEFTANVSHELKTPLTSISGYAELIEQGIVKDEEVKRIAGEIRNNSTRLLTLINDIINLSELDSEGLKLHIEKIDLYDAVRKCARNLAVNAHNRNVDLIVMGTPAMINADKDMVEEVIYNLCDNAIRYNNVGGKVYIDVGATSDNKVKLVVKDTGIGIPKEHQARIFERFYRVDKSRSKETGGTGLGLAIVKHILTQHGASLTLDSDEGKGTCITVVFDEAK